MAHGRSEEFVVPQFWPAQDFAGAAERRIAPRPTGVTATARFLHVGVRGSFGRLGPGVLHAVAKAQPRVNVGMRNEEARKAFVVRLEDLELAPLARRRSHDESHLFFFSGVDDNSHLATQRSGAGSPRLVRVPEIGNQLAGVKADAHRRLAVPSARNREQDPAGGILASLGRQKLRGVTNILPSVEDSDAVPAANLNLRAKLQPHLFFAGVAARHTPNHAPALRRQFKLDRQRQTLRRVGNRVPIAGGAERLDGGEFNILFAFTVIGSKHGGGDNRRIVFGDYS